MVVPSCSAKEKGPVKENFNSNLKLIKKNRIVNLQTILLCDRIKVTN